MEDNFSTQSPEESVQPITTQPLDPRLDSRNPDMFNQAPKAPSLEEILASPNASLAEKEQAATNLALQEKAAMDKELGEKTLAYQNYQAEQNRYNKLLKVQQQNPGKITLPDAPTIEKFGLTAEDVSKVSNPVDPMAANVAAKQVSVDKANEQEDLLQAQLDALGAKKAQREETMANGYMAEQERLAKKRQELMDQQIALVDKQQDVLSEIDPNRFWANKSTGSKIVGALAIALGEVGRSLTGGQSNSALSIINDAIDRDINAQKVNNEQKLALKQNALKRVSLEIDKYAQLSNDASRKFEMQKYSDALMQQREQLKQQQALSAYKNRALLSDGMAKEEFEQLATPEERARAIALPSGKVVLATNQDTAQKLNTALEKNRAAEHLSNLLIAEMQDFSNWNKLTPQLYSEKKQRIENLRQFLVGALREPVTGPGVLSAQERAILEKTLADPAILIASPALALKRVEAIKGTLGSLKNAAYLSAGIKPQISKEQSAIDNYRIYALKNGKDPAAIDRVLYKQK